MGRPAAGSAGGVFTNIVWLLMILAVIWGKPLQLWSKWGFQTTIVSSLGANLVVAILSGTRRRLAHRRLWGWLGQVAKLFLWLACQVADLATTNAIGNLSLSGSDASEEEKQVAAFWAMFLLLHLGGPDNLTAYALEDNKISDRKKIEMFYRILGASYAIYNNAHRGSRSWALLPMASVVMLVAGAVRYMERVTAQGEANLASMQEDVSSRSSGDDIHENKMKLLKWRIKSTKRQGRLLRDREALLLAQDLFPIWRHALVDSSVNPKSERQKANKQILKEWDWEGMCKVAEMELSLIYEFLYTKAILAQTCYYYLIRLLSPLLTAAAAFLFCFWQQQGDDRHRAGGSYVWITYALLAITFLMDVAWLLRALGSTWAYGYFQEQAPAWLRHRALHACGRWWYSLHRFVVAGLDPVSHRRWSGTIGQYNLLDECTATTRTCWSQFPEWWPWSGAGDDTPKEMRYLSKLPTSVKELVFKRVTKILQQAINTKENKNDKTMYNRHDIRTSWGQKAFEVGNMPLPTRTGENYIFGDEFEEDVLLWHVATCMALPHRQNAKHARAVEVLSEYMMFLVAVRRQMLPGLVLHSQLQVTRKTLAKDIWDDERSKKFLSRQESSMNMSNKEKLAWLLRQAKPVEDDTEIHPTVDVVIPASEGTQLVQHAAKLYFLLSGEEPPDEIESGVARWPPPQIEEKTMKIIFNVWVDKMVYAAVRCSRDAHAEQLSAGGDLTTVLWMLIQHAGPFCMGEAPDIILSMPEPTSSLPPPPPVHVHLPHLPPPVPQPQPQPKKKKKKKKKAPLPAPKPPTTMDGIPPVPLPAPKPPTTMDGIPPMLLPPPMAPCPLPPPPPYCPMCPPCYHPSYSPACPPYYDPSWRPQCPHQQDKPEAPRRDEGEDSSSDEDSEE